MSAGATSRGPAIPASSDHIVASNTLSNPQTILDNAFSKTETAELRDTQNTEEQATHQAALPVSPSRSSKDAAMDQSSTVDARALVRLFQCKQCSFPLRTPMTLPCGNSLCPPCLPERHKRENISYPMIIGRREGFMCPFKECGQEHSVADCAQDVTLTKVVQRMALHIAEYRDANPDTPVQVDEQIRQQADTELAQIQVPRSTRPVAHSRIVPGGYLAATYVMAESGELRYDSDVTFTPQDLPVASYRDLDTSLFTELQKAIRQEVDCQLCWNLLYDPLTTPCGHTFCRSCVARILDHSTSCPVCRKILRLPPGVQRESGNKLLQKVLETYCAADLTARTEGIETEREAAKKLVPLFVVTLGYPDMPMVLHVFEPRYRLMIRRVLETDSKTFGMVAHNATGAHQGDDINPHTEFLRRGILLRIVHAEQVSDGRIFLECMGINRFNVLDWHEQDGYVVATTERIEDVSFEQEERVEADEVQRTTNIDSENSDPIDPLAQLETMSTVELLGVSVDFVRRMSEASAPWLSNGILRMYGQPPYEDASSFPYWFASVLPIAEEEKYALLGTTSVRARLKITAEWVRRIEAQRW